ncbi:hypothetical protein ACWCP8_32385 [Streptomyces sp. NPDC002206]
MKRRLTKRCSSVRIIGDLLTFGLTIEDLRSCADRLHLLAQDPPPRCGSAEPGVSTSRVVGRRLAALDAAINRRTRLRERLAQRASGETAASASRHPSRAAGKGTTAAW